MEALVALAIGILVAAGVYLAVVGVVLSILATIGRKHNAAAAG